jgi:hypothetical protein
MRGMGNIVNHDYADVDLRIVWEAGTTPVPEICAVLQTFFARQENQPAQPPGAREARSVEVEKRQFVASRHDLCTVAQGSPFKPCGFSRLFKSLSPEAGSEKSPQGYNGIEQPQGYNSNPALHGRPDPRTRVRNPT